MYKRRICYLILTFLICFHQQAKAQGDSSSSKIVYLELFGSGDIYAVNFEYMFKQNQRLQAGVSWLPGTWQITSDNDRNFLYFPLAYHYLIGQRNHKIDLSAGVLYKLTWHTASPNNHNIRPEVGVSYRYQRKKGIFLKAGVNVKIPASLSVDSDALFFYTERHWLLWPAVGAGWSF
ncbi:MAG: hypothetical protein H7296_06315 [Bacteroidia bacterium]|nr:hypothetical protein [Bacteroidia bacterium]